MTFGLPDVFSCVKINRRKFGLLYVRYAVRVSQTSRSQDNVLCTVLRKKTLV